MVLIIRTRKNKVTKQQTAGACIEGWKSRREAYLPLLVGLTFAFLLPFVRTPASFYLFIADRFDIHGLSAWGFAQLTRFVLSAAVVLFVITRWERRPLSSVGLRNSSSRTF